MTTMEAPPQEVTVVRGDLTAAFAGAASHASTVAVDSETDGLDPARSRLLTVQVHAPGAGTEIVQLGAHRPERLIRLLECGDTVKVLHHAVFDLSFLAAAYGVQARSVRCTKVASKILDPEAESHSLAPLLDRWLGVRLDKKLQTSDWSAETLTPAQIHYAADDVLYLPDLLGALSAALEKAGRLSLAASCWEYLPTRVRLQHEDIGDVFAY